MLDAQLVVEQSMDEVELMDVVVAQSCYDQVVVDTEFDKVVADVVADNTVVLDERNCS